MHPHDPAPRRPARSRRRRAALLGALVLAGGAAATQVPTAGAVDPAARGRLVTADGTLVGRLRFHTNRDGVSTTMQVEVFGATGTALGAFHGIHVHANDNPANGTGCVADPAAAASTWFVSADGHYRHDPTELHGDHAGDLPPIYIGDDGRGWAQVRLDRVGPAELANLVVILHAGVDNLGNVPEGVAATDYTANAPDATARTDATGNAGDRFACAVVKPT